MGSSSSSLDVAKKVAAFAADKKAENVVILSMSGVVNYCDYFVICSGTISRHVKAIAEGVVDGLHELGIKVKFKQGLDSISRSKALALKSPAASMQDLGAGAWVLLDMGDVVVHIFEGESREFYALDHLWREAGTVEWK